MTVVRYRKNHKLSYRPTVCMTNDATTKTREAGYCSDTERATAMRRLAETAGVPTGKLSIRDPLDDSNIYTKYTESFARKKARVVRIREGDGENMTAAEMSRFMTWAWSVVGDHHKNRWATDDAEALAVSYDYIDSQVRA